MTDLKRVQLDGDAIIIRVLENGVFSDKFFIRNTDSPSWREVGSYQEFKALVEAGK